MMEPKSWAEEPAWCERCGYFLSADDTEPNICEACCAEVEYLAARMGEA